MDILLDFLLIGIWSGRNKRNYLEQQSSILNSVHNREYDDF